MIVSIQMIVEMLVNCFLFPMDMGMHMAVDQRSVGMFMAVGMGMFVDVLKTDGILYHQNSCRNHNPQPQIKPRSGFLSQQKNTKSHPQNGAME